MFVDQAGMNVRQTRPNLNANLVKMMLGLASSLQQFGKPLRVFTNTPQALAEFIRTERHPSANFVDLCEIHFPLDIPQGIRFYAGHHKIYLFSHFATEDAVNCLLDIDMVFAANPELFEKRIQGAPDLDGWVYDISDQVFPAYGTGVVQQDMKRIGAQNAFPRWYGGEFIMGSRKLFQMLNNECQQLLPAYLEVVETLHHVGDEALVSAALNNCEQKLSLGEAGCCGLVLRFWSARTAHVQKKVTALCQAALWHLPASKPLLQSFSRHRDLARLYREVATRSYLSGVRHILAPKQQADGMRN